eukprot:TRINITY_DN418_c0_g1_i1.p1 TRINITY_DN418_c0_g1~~TRINITY_DN418_c0_g1_i1.p1  ORF type:complete len:268 (-),score=50.79 TRINITY_DN418_c0_g1_i1:44-847(-)
MSRFVAVTNPELPRSEQDQEALKKHQRFNETVQDATWDMSVKRARPPPQLEPVERRTGPLSDADILDPFERRAMLKKQKAKQHGTSPTQGKDRSRERERGSWRDRPGRRDSRGREYRRGGRGTDRGNEADGQDRYRDRDRDRDRDRYGDRDRDRERRGSSSYHRESERGRSGERGSRDRSVERDEFGRVVDPERKASPQSRSHRKVSPSPPPPPKRTRENAAEPADDVPKPKRVKLGKKRERKQSKLMAQLAEMEKKFGKPSSSGTD